MRRLCFSIALMLFASPPALAEPGPSEVCSAITGAAAETGLPPAFLTRVLWETTGLRSLDAVLPTAGALAGFAERYGNPGIAALALAGGPDQADRFLNGGGVPVATVDFVILTTGLEPEVWRDTPPQAPDFRLSAGGGFRLACLELAEGSWETPLPQLTAQPLPPVRIEPVRLHPSLRSLRPKMRPVPKLAKWGAQLAFGKSATQARANFRRATQGCVSVVGQHPDVIYVENRVRGRRGYWMARVSRMQRDAAEDICRAARDRGCSCVVYKNY